MDDNFGPMGFLQNKDPNDIPSVEKLVDQTRAELDSFKAEQTQLRMRIQEILEENNRAPKHSNDEIEHYKLFSDEALKNAQKQIQILLREKEELTEMNECAQRTIINNEKELQNYRNEFYKPIDTNELKKKYNDAITVMEQKINQQKDEIFEQSKVIKMLYDHKKHSLEKINRLQDKLTEKSMDAINNKDNDTKIIQLEKEILNYCQQIKEYENSLQSTQELLVQAINREGIAMQKVNESLILAETAVAEKNEAERRAIAFEDECTQLASNIGSIMDRAAEKVEADVADLKRKLQEKEEELIESRNQFNEQEELHKQLTQQMDARHNRMEQRYKEILKQNAKLSEEVQVTGKKLHEMELKVEQNDTESYEKRMLELQKQYETQMQLYMDNNKLLKAKYKNAVDDLTKEFELVIYRLKEENSDLKTDITLLQSQTSNRSSNLEESHTEDDISIN